MNAQEAREAIRQIIIDANELLVRVEPLGKGTWGAFAEYVDSFPESYGALIGEVDIVDCVTRSESPWFVGRYGFVLKNPVLYDKPVPCRGALGFFEPEIHP